MRETWASRPLRLTFRGARVYMDRRPFAHMLSEFESIPIGQADAAVRGALADSFRIGRTVNAVAFRRERDPDDTYGIVWAWRQLELFLHVHAAQVQFGVVMIGGVLCNGGDLEVACR